MFYEVDVDILYEIFINITANRLMSMAIVSAKKKVEKWSFFVILSVLSPILSGMYFRAANGFYKFISLSSTI